MARSRYSQVVDLENWNSSHSLAVLSVPPGSSVLDLGTADGSVAEALKKRGCTVCGIEVDEQAADAARQVCDRVIVADLEAKDALDALGDETFDVILVLDVLEHLRDPAPVLKRATRHLTPNGLAIVSIPNVTHAALRLSLLKGRFNYTEQGLLDRTHLRFFDRQGAERLISEAGLTISQTLRVRRELEETEIAVNKEGVPAELLESLADDPDATTYQFVFVAGRDNGLPESPIGGTLSERLIAENETLLRQFRELEAYAKSLQAERAQTKSLQDYAAALREELRAQFMELATYVGNPKTTLAGIEEVNADELTNIRDELARAQSLQARANADVGVLLARFSEFEAHVVVEKEALRGQFREADTYAKTLEASLTAIRRDSARDLAECRDELARTQSSHERITAELFDIRQERDDLRQELAGRAHEAHQMHRDLKYCKADVAVKEAFISDLRKQLLAMNAVVLDRDRLRVKRRRLLSTHKQLLARQQSLETSLNAFRTYANSAGFRFTEAVIRHLRAFPGVFSMTRALVRRVVVKR